MDLFRFNNQKPGASQKQGRASRSKPEEARSKPNEARSKESRQKQPEAEKRRVGNFWAYDLLRLKYSLELNV